MADQVQNRWIVIISKQPRGPFTEGEVKELLAQHIIRINDIGFRLDGENPNQHYEWKLLWQFPEFDRRRMKTDEEAKQAFLAKKAALPPTEPVAPFVRKEMEPEEIRRRTLENLPEELANLSLQDLMPRSTRMVETQRKSESVPERLSLNPASSSGFDLRWIYGSVFIIATSFYFFHLLGAKTNPQDKTTEERPERKMNFGAQVQPHPGAGVSQAPHAPPQPTPVAPIQQTIHEDVPARATGNIPEDRGTASDEGSAAQEDDRGPAEEGNEEGGTSGTESRGEGTAIKKAPANNGEESQEEGGERPQNHPNNWGGD